MELLLFLTTQGALDAEEALLESGVYVDVVPAPAGSDKLCGLALEVSPDEFERAAGVLDERGILFIRHGR